MKNPLRNLHLRLVLDVGILAFETRSMYRCVERDTFEVISLYWKALKWHGEFRLYKVRR